LRTRPPSVVIGLAGRARSGKSTAARYLAQEHGFGCLAFADPLRAIARGLFPGWTHEWHLEGPGKDQVDPTCGFTPRAVLQELGAGGRRVHPDFWLYQADRAMALWRAEALADTRTPSPGVVWTDVRYPNEAAWIGDRGGVLVHLRREGAPAVRPHESEDGLIAGPHDVVIRNDSTLETLFAALDGVVLDRLGLERGGE
jgi:hypothetical protein